MTKIFIPPLDAPLRLLGDWKPDWRFLTSYDNVEIRQNFGVKLDVGDWPEYRDSLPPGATHHPYTWWDADPLRRDRSAKWQQEQITQANVIFPKGTVFVFDRYHISHSGSHAITVRILASPDLRIHPKKLGGKGKGKLRCYFTIADLNSFPEVEDAHVPNQ